MTCTHRSLESNSYTYLGKDEGGRGTMTLKGRHATRYDFEQSRSKKGGRDAQKRKSELRQTRPSTS